MVCQPILDFSIEEIKKLENAIACNKNAEIAVNSKMEDGFHLGLLLPTWFNFNPSMDKYNHMPCNVWDEITYPFLNFNGSTVEV